MSVPLNTLVLFIDTL